MTDFSCFDFEVFLFFVCMYFSFIFFFNFCLIVFQFFSAMIACFSTNFLLSAFEGHPTELSHPGLVRFNTFPVGGNLFFNPFLPE